LEQRSKSRSRQAFWRGISLFILVVFTGGALISTGLAVPVDLDDRDAHLFTQGNVEWGFFVNDTPYDQCVTDAATFYPEEAELGDQADAWDGGPTFIIGETEFFDSDNSAELTAKSIKAGPEGIAGLRATVTHTAVTKKPILRSMIALRNNSDTAKERIIVFDQASGGDDSGAVRSTSDGDLNAENTDRWIVWSDHATTPEDAVLVSAFFGRGGPREKVHQLLCSPTETNDPLTVNFDIRVPAGKTRYLVFFSRLAHTNAGGISGADIFSQNTPGLFQGMTAKQKSRVLNWNL
jgi:hypothetical protein